MHCGFKGTATNHDLLQKATPLHTKKITPLLSSDWPTHLGCTTRPSHH